MKSEHFKIHELVPSHIYNKYGEKAWRFIPKQLIHTIDMLKLEFPKGTITINNYYWGGDREWSGLRTSSSPWYSETSMHSFGMAIDAIFSNYKTDEVRQYIIDNPSKFPFVKGIELGVSWLHIDCRNEQKVIMFSKN